MGETDGVTEKMKPNILFALLAVGIAGGSLSNTRAAEVERGTTRAVTPGSAATQRIGIELLAPRAPMVRDYPVATGLVFPEGALASAPGGRLVDGQGRPVPFQAEATGWWNLEKTSIKWLLLRFQASTDQQYFFEPGQEPLAPDGAPIATAQNGNVNVDTGPLRVVVSGTKPALFDQVTLNGHAMLAGIQPPFVLTLSDGKGEVRTMIHDWRVMLEEATPLYASVKATGFFHSHAGWSFAERPVARIDVRYEFFKGENFVRVFHTLTWMVNNSMVGGREISLGLRPNLGESGTARVGMEDVGGQPWETAWSPTAHIVAQQDEADHFAVTVSSQKVKEGKHLGGWVGLEGQDGRSINVALRHAWQMYPNAFEIGGGRLQVQLWPQRGPSMSFTPLALMTPEFFYHSVWKVHPWSREEGHFVHERARHEFFQYTAEGAARTHELTVSFHDRTSTRSPQELNALTARPLALRQDPASAMRVPFMGFEIMPVQKEKYPDIERAVDLLGKMAMGRWAAMHEHGFWRFGFTRWGAPANSDNGNSLYRWMDGSQYDQQLIPWLLYLRGGDRQFLEEAEITSRFLMDVGVNHFNTRGYPTGYMSTAGGTPFPYIPFHDTKGTKVHFLSYYYHLTGYKRAREVMQEVIDGTLATTSKNPKELPAWFRRTGGREAYNMNVFWVNAYHETWDPRLKQYAQEWKDLAANREYVPAINEFRPPRIYLYNGLVLQQRFWRDPHLQEVMLRNLKGTVLADPASGVERHVENVIGNQWAYEQTQDRAYAEIASDIAHSLSEVVPGMDFTLPKPPPYSVRGNEFYRQFLLPILVGASLGNQVGLPPHALYRRDTFFSLNIAAKTGKAATGVAYVRPLRDGDLKVFVRLSKAGEKPVALTVSDSTGRTVATRALVGTKPTALRTEGEGYELLEAHPAMADIVLQGAKQSETYKLVFENFDASTCALILAEAQIIHQAPPGGTMSVHDLGGQYYAGARFYAKTTADIVTVVSKSPTRSPYAIRDAQTRELLFRSTAGDKPEQKHHLGKGRLVAFIVAANSPHSEKHLAGVEPFFSATREDWFAPEAVSPTY